MGAYEHDPAASDLLARYGTPCFEGGVAAWYAQRCLDALTAAGLTVVRTGEVPPWMVLADGEARSLAQPDEIHYVLRGDL